MLLATLSILRVLVNIVVIFVLLDIYRRIGSEKKYHVKESFTAYLLMAPAIFLGFFFVLLPIFFSFGYAFTDFELLSPDEIQPNGFDNFVRLFEELHKQGDIYHALLNTLLFVVLVVPLQIGIALLLALFCNNKKPGTTVFKICFFAPVAISLSVTAYLWLTILSPNKDGIMNSVLAIFNIPTQKFFTDDSSFTVISWMVIISAWQGCGYQMLIFLSALGNIRKELYEAASIDGAGPFRRFIDITLPGLRPTFLYILITVFVGACRVMIQPMIFTDYQPKSMTISYYMYQQGFTYQHIGYSCAVALFMTIIIGTITFIQRKVLGEKKS